MTVEQLVDLACQVLSPGTLVELIPANEHDSLLDGEPIACVTIAQTFDIYRRPTDFEPEFPWQVDMAYEGEPGRCSRHPSATQVPPMR